jgi:hypothetical protein
MQCHITEDMKLQPWLNITVVGDDMPCSLADVCRHVGGISSVLLQFNKLHGVTFQQSVLLMLTAVNSSDLKVPVGHALL